MLTSIFNGRLALILLSFAPFVESVASADTWYTHTPPNFCYSGNCTYPNDGTLIRTLGNFNLRFDPITGALLEIWHIHTGYIVKAEAGGGGLFSFSVPLVEYLPNQLEARHSPLAQFDDYDGIATSPPHLPGRKGLKLRWLNLRSAPPSADHPVLAITQFPIYVDVFITLGPLNNPNALEFELHFYQNGQDASGPVPVRISQLLFPDLNGLRPFHMPNLGTSDNTMMEVRTAQKPSSNFLFQTFPYPDGRTPFYVSAAWSRHWIAELTRNDGGRKIASVYHPGRAYLQMVPCPTNQTSMVGWYESANGRVGAEELLLKRDHKDINSLRMAWRRPFDFWANTVQGLNPFVDEQLPLVNASAWWKSPVVTLQVSTNGNGCQ